MKILLTRTFASDDAGLPAALPGTQPLASRGFAEQGEEPSGSDDVGAAWLAATGVPDAERETLIARAAVALQPQAAGAASDAWLEATGAGFAS